jgi:hypothetical protein
VNVTQSQSQCDVIDADPERAGPLDRMNRHLLHTGVQIATPAPRDQHKIKGSNSVARIMIPLTYIPGQLVRDDDEKRTPTTVQI